MNVETIKVSSRTKATSSSLRIPDCPQVSKSSSAWDQKFSSCSASELSGAPVKLSSESTVQGENFPDIIPEFLSFLSHTPKKWEILLGSGFLQPSSPSEAAFGKAKYLQRTEGRTTVSLTESACSEPRPHEPRQHGALGEELPAALPAERQAKFQQKNVFSRINISVDHLRTINFYQLP